MKSDSNRNKNLLFEVTEVYEKLRICKNDIPAGRFYNRALFVFDGNILFVGRRK
jgi:hypothetical protein